MVQTLYYAHYVMLLVFGILLSIGFSGFRVFEKKHILSAAILFVICGGIQLSLLFILDEKAVWEFYPLITHLPVMLFLTFRYKKRIITSISAVTTAYLCCQPAKWFGLLASALTHNILADKIAQILVLILFGIISLHNIAPFISQLFNKDTKSVWIFGSIPVVYYLFDYITGIYTTLLAGSNQLTAQFLPFVLCLFFVMFCVVYYKAYEQKADAEQKEQLIRISLQQQSARIAAVEQTEKELQILRHDMRLFLNNLALCIQNNETQLAREMIDSYASQIDSTKIEQYCKYELVNYVLSHYGTKCRNAEIPFSCTVEIDFLSVDEVMLSTILSNALDNALNAQAPLSREQQGIKVMLKKVDGRLLLSVKNTIGKPPVFCDGLPVTNQKGHGYGTQSIRYITEKLGGNCQFSVQQNWFILRIVL